MVSASDEAQPQRREVTRGQCLDHPRNRTQHTAPGIERKGASTFCVFIHANVAERGSKLEPREGTTQQSSYRPCEIKLNRENPARKGDECKSITTTNSAGRASVQQAETVYLTTNWMTTVKVVGIERQQEQGQP